MFLSLMLAGVFLLGCSSKGDFVEVSKVDNRYFALKSGKTYIPNGLNFCWAPFAWDSADE